MRPVSFWLLRPWARTPLASRLFAMVFHRPWFRYGFAPSRLNLNANPYMFGFEIAACLLYYRRKTTSDLQSFLHQRYLADVTRAAWHPVDRGVQAAIDAYVKFARERELREQDERNARSRAS